MRAKLIELIKNAPTINFPVGSRAQGKTYQTAANIADHLLANGVVVLPCKVGQTVYCIEHRTIRECLVKSVKSLTYENETTFFVEAECEIVSPFYSDGRKIKHGLMAVWEIEWGSWYRAFRTREEAEEALAKMKGGNGND